MAKRWKTWVEFGENLGVIKFKPTRSNSSQAGGQLVNLARVGLSWNTPGNIPGVYQRACRPTHRPIYCRLTVGQRPVGCFRLAPNHYATLANSWWNCLQPHLTPYRPNVSASQHITQDDSASRSLPVTRLWWYWQCVTRLLRLLSKTKGPGFSSYKNSRRLLVQKLRRNSSLKQGPWTTTQVDLVDFPGTVYACVEEGAVYMKCVTILTSRSADMVDIVIETIDGFL